MIFRISLILSALLLSSCTRTFYREQADDETYGAIRERDADPRWALNQIDILPPPGSRLHDPYDPDFPPMPPDDAAAGEYLLRADGKRGWKHWWDHGTVPSVELSEWQSALPLTDGKLILAPEVIMQQAQLNGREYRTQIENLYLSSLDLTLNRFEFATQWFATNRTIYEHFGTNGFPTETNTLTTDSNLGFSRSLAAGGQLLVNFANSFVWEYTGKTQGVSSNISMNFIQPLLRDFGRQVRMEALTQGERSLLYQVRIFARFRKELYVDLAVNRYLTLLQQAQFIRNQETNVLRQEQNYARQQAQRLAGKTTIVQEDQAFTALQEARAQITQDKTDLENGLDRFKLELGLPPTVPARMDESPLQAFLFSDPKLDQLQVEFDQLQLEFRKHYEKMTVEQMDQWVGRLNDFHQRAMFFLNQIEKETEAWKKQPVQGIDQADVQRVQQFRDGLSTQLSQVRKELLEFPSMLEQFKVVSKRLAMNDRKRMFELRVRDIELAVGQLFVIQNQVRVYSINLPAIKMTEEEAIRLAIENRLDLMNDRARVVDAWRQVAIQANQLEAYFNIVTGMDIGTQPGSLRPFDFSAAASRYRVGFQFEGPLNRQIERNNYRQSLIQYHRARRDYMLRQDQVMLELRLALRQLETDRQNFEISRRAFIAATRQVESVPLQLRLNRSIDPLEQLNTLSQLLGAKNTLISRWFSYERGRMQLLLATEQLQVDDQGMYRDDSRTSIQFEPPSPPRRGDTPRPVELFSRGMGIHQ